MVCEGDFALCRVLNGSKGPKVSASLLNDDMLVSCRPRPEATQRVYAGGAIPSAVHCWDQIIGRSISRLTPKPRGNRPSIAAATMGGATKARESVMRIDRSVWRCHCRIPVPA